jgi:hypothetical protein
MAETVEEAKLARDAVLGTGQVVQMGSQWLSDPVQRKVRDLVRSGALGQVTKIEQCWNDNNQAAYEEPKILYSYSSSYANRFGDHSLIRGKEATLYAHGGEGSPRWLLTTGRTACGRAARRRTGT